MENLLKDYKEAFEKIESLPDNELLESIELKDIVKNTKHYIDYTENETIHMEYSKRCNYFMELLCLEKESILLELRSIEHLVIIESYSLIDFNKLDTLIKQNDILTEGERYLKSIIEANINQKRYTLKDIKSSFTSFYSVFDDLPAQDLLKDLLCFLQDIYTSLLK